MKFVFPFLISILVIVESPKALAQLDSSYELLLGNSVTPTNKANSRKKLVEKRKVASEPSGPSAPSVSQPSVQQAPASLLSSATPAPARAAEPSLTSQAQSLFNADADLIQNFYQERFDPADPRQNRVEISFAPTFITNESTANYSYRNYRSVFSAAVVGANVWLTPAIGIGGNFLFSLGADASGDATTGGRSPVRHEMFDVAVKFRQFFGFTPTSKSVEFDVIYSDYKFNVDSDDVYRSRLKTTGLGLKSTLRVPTSNDFAWTVGGSFFPRLQHSETAAGSELSSGVNSENVRIGLQLGSEVRLSKESQLFWEASASSERNLFSGTAAAVDPNTGVAPKNVSITNSFYLLSFGYRWGN
jgi:hypothetical protein